MGFWTIENEDVSEVSVRFCVFSCVSISAANLQCSILPRARDSKGQNWGFPKLGPSPSTDITVARLWFSRGGGCHEGSAGAHPCRGFHAAMCSPKHSSVQREGLGKPDHRAA